MGYGDIATSMGNIVDPINLANAFNAIQQSQTRQRVNDAWMKGFQEYEQKKQNDSNFSTWAKTAERRNPMWRYSPEHFAQNSEYANQLQATSGMLSEFEKNGLATPSQLQVWKGMLGKGDFEPVTHEMQSVANHHAQLMESQKAQLDSEQRAQEAAKGMYSWREGQENELWGEAQSALNEIDEAGTMTPEDRLSYLYRRKFTNPKALQAAMQMNANWSRAARTAPTSAKDLKGQEFIDDEVNAIGSLVEANSGLEKEKEFSRRLYSLDKDERIDYKDLGLGKTPQRVLENYREYNRRQEHKRSLQEASYARLEQLTASLGDNAMEVLSPATSGSYLPDVIATAKPEALPIQLHMNRDDNSPHLAATDARVVQLANGKSGIAFNLNIVGADKNLSGQYIFSQGVNGPIVMEKVKGRVPQPIDKEESDALMRQTLLSYYGKNARNTIKDTSNEIISGLKDLDDPKAQAVYNRIKLIPDVIETSRGKAINIQHNILTDVLPELYYASSVLLDAKIRGTKKIMKDIPSLPPETINVMNELESLSRGGAK